MEILYGILPNSIFNYLYFELMVCYSTRFHCLSLWLSNQLKFHFNPNHLCLNCYWTCIPNQQYFIQFGSQQTIQRHCSWRSFPNSSISGQFHYSMNLFLRAHSQSLLHCEDHLLLQLKHLQTHLVFYYWISQLGVSEIAHL